MEEKQNAIARNPFLQAIEILDHSEEKDQDIALHKELLNFKQIESGYLEDSRRNQHVLNMQNKSNRSHNLCEDSNSNYNQNLEEGFQHRDARYAHSLMANQHQTLEREQGATGDERRPEPPLIAASPYEPPHQLADAQLPYDPDIMANHALIPKAYNGNGMNSFHESLPESLELNAEEDCPPGTEAITDTAQILDDARNQKEI